MTLNDKKILIAIGRLEPQKDFLLLINSISYLNDEYHLFIIGDGSLRDQLEDRIDTLNLNHKVTLLGARNNVIRYLKHCDIFVLSSIYEGFPNVA